MSSLSGDCVRYSFIEFLGKRLPEAFAHLDRPYDSVLFGERNYAFHWAWMQFRLSFAQLGWNKWIDKLHIKIHLFLCGVDLRLGYHGVGMRLLCLFNGTMRHILWNRQYNFPTNHDIEAAGKLISPINCLILFTLSILNPWTNFVKYLVIIHNGSKVGLSLE